MQLAVLRESGFGRTVGHHGGHAAGAVIVLAQIGAGLHFNDFKLAVTVIFQTVFYP